VADFLGISVGSDDACVPSAPCADQAPPDAELAVLLARTRSVAVGAKTVFMRLGIANAEAAAVASGAGLTVIQNRCIKVEYARLRDAINAARAT